MEPLRRKILRIALKLFDLGVMVTVFISAAVGVSYEVSTISLAEFFQMRVKVENFLLFLFLMGLWHVLLVSIGFYRRRRLAGYFADLSDTVKLVGVFTLILYFISQVLEIALITPLFLTLFLSGTFVAMLASRIGLRIILKRVRLKGRNLRYLLIVGTNLRALKFASKIQQLPELGYQLIGFVDEQWAGPQNLKRLEWPLVSDLENFPQYIRNNVVDEVVVSLPIQSFYLQTHEIVQHCEQQGVIVRSIPHLFDCRHTNVETEYIDDIALITCYQGALKGSMVAVKRAFDLILATLLLIVSTPLFLIVALIIKLDSPGPAFFIQERIGLNKRKFKLYKFRTMEKAAEQRQGEYDLLNAMDGPVFKAFQDPRITRFGRVLRKTSIDELPQLFNVIRGEMSLVGPRPLPIRDFGKFQEDWHRRRVSVRPGITCLWQVQGRNTIGFEEWMRLDMLYIDQWSLQLDLVILMKTIPAVISQKGAN